MLASHIRVCSVHGKRRCVTLLLCSKPKRITHNQSLYTTEVPPSQSQSQTPAGNEKLEAAASEEFARRQTTIDFKQLKYKSKIPQAPVTNPFDKQPVGKCTEPNIDSKTLQLLERLSLVNLETKEAFKNLKDSIEFAERVVEISTEGVTPMYTVLEDLPLKTRPDTVTDGNIKDEILKNASLTEEDYFVAPPGNIPLEQKEKNLE